MICLGIESTAHTLGIGIATEKKILANEKTVYVPKFTGIHPRKASDAHAKNFESVLRAALSKARIGLGDVDVIAFSQGPGLGACLRVGCIGAKSLALTLRKPLVGVNHCVAHIEIAKLFTRARDPLVLYVSGGNTQIIAREEERYRVLGETMDIGVGNLFDTFGRRMGLERAHGGIIEQMAKGGGHVELPYIVKAMSFSFTGLLTDAEKKLATHKKEDLCFSLQEYAFSMLTEAMERALVLTRKKEIIICGGVAQNKRLCWMLRTMGNEHGARFGVAPNEFNADNGAMIAYTGLLMFRNGARLKPEKCEPVQKFRVDEVELW
ncbi:MAG: KEOPS complex N(6)-L-threonylcarbamoyladenine synthase Kae1 [Candidatus Micrarchaeota archaeon]